MDFKDMELPGGNRNFIGYGRSVPKVKWPDGAKVVINLVLNYEEGSEFSLPSGDNRQEGFTEYDYPAMDPRYRDLAAESVYEYGSRAGVWRLARLFDRYGIKITVSACAVALKRNPEVASWIVEAGHETMAHGWRWSELWLMSREEEKEEIRRAVADIEQMTGQRPVGWNSRYGPSVHTRELLVEDGGFVYDSDAYNDDLPYFVDVNGKQQLILPYTKTYNDTRFIIAQGFSQPDDFVNTCMAGLDLLYEEGETHPKMMSIGLHARIMGQPARAAALRDFMEHALNKPGVIFMRRIDIANWWLEHHKEFTSE
ncbi:Peptidoglycan/xylan/chitin deacetylase, PgdA/CDA1 family [Paenibacillus sp. yr247]|uniref:polysaccharide deacetylase family protein n=1 Tax=Paenibacillus sp. yr247 TaxID=1761880 RepID=UPI0008814CCB|nr:polysaccharide deacetylase family protein [Paenibacillus sp. yr247]SDO33432.1 Peptidoglycan/xylan/chitin deacetylase, PgdA/CDA1 family [Paenibacillus sp. yr247]